MSHPAAPRIALLVDTSTGWGRSIVNGVIAYSDKNGPWDLYLRPSGTNERLRLPATWKCDGVIARVVTEELAQQLADMELPVVNVSATEYGSGFARVSHDNAAVVDIAVDHFANRGIRSFGYYGAPRRSYSLARQELYVEICRKRGFDCRIFSPSRDYGSGSEHRERLESWLAQLPHTTGVLTWGVERGVEVINAAHGAGLNVPEHIAVLGGDDDELICRAVRPSLSGIRFAGERIGYEAAHVLDDMLHGSDVKGKQIFFKPAGVNIRASTDVLAIRDAEVAAAVSYIRDNVHEPLRLNDVADAVTAAPRSLQRGFQHELRHSFSDEVVAARIERAKQLLADTDWAMPKIAESCGYGSPEYMATVFRKETGVTPRTYRRQVKGC